MKKYIFLSCCMITLNVYAVSFFNDKFDGDFCRNGHAAPWVGACVCEKPIAYTGRYCDISIEQECLLNADCASEYFCLSQDEKKGCVPVKARGPVVVENIEFILSDMLLNYQSAIDFCKGLGAEYRQAIRSDFDCADIGPTCLDTRKIIVLQEIFGMKGFFWLDAKDEANAYYADINDGTVYETSRKNIKTMQALCIKKEK